MIQKNNLNVKNKINELTISDIVNYNKIQTNNDEYIEIMIQTLALLSNQPIEVIETLDINDAVELFKEINFTETEISNELFNLNFELDGVKYITKTKDNNISFSIKEINLITKAIKQSSTEFLYDVAAILFQPEGIRDYSEEGIAKRKELFKDTMTYDYILPYIIKLGQEYIKIN